MQRSNYDRYSITSSALASSFCGAVSPSVCLRAVDGLVAEGALAEAVGATKMVIRKAVEWQAPELPLAACSDLLAKPPRVGVDHSPHGFLGSTGLTF